MGGIKQSQSFMGQPSTSLVPITSDSTIVFLEPYHVDLLPEYGYVSREYLMSGYAAGNSYCTRLLLRCPTDQASFSGFVVVEPSHLWGGTSIWRAVNRWLMRNGHAWLEVDSQAPSAIGNVKAADPVRYADMHFMQGPLSKDFKEIIPFQQGSTLGTLSDAYDAFKERWWPATVQSPEILVHASQVLRTEQLGLTATRVVLAGLSQTGGLTRRFITHSSHLRLPDGTIPFQGFIPCQSGGEALPDVLGSKVIELLGEAEFQSVRVPCGVAGQVKGIRHRRPDSDSFRLYEVAGMAHRESRYASTLDFERIGQTAPSGDIWSTFSNSFIYHAVFQHMESWTSGTSIPPSSAILDVSPDTFELARDQHGNALAGVRTLHTEAPLAHHIAATPLGRPYWYCGSEKPFTPKKLREIYGSMHEYRSLAGQAISRQVKAGFLCQCDAETLRRETVEPVKF